MEKYKILIRSTEYFTHEMEGQDEESAESKLLDEIDSAIIEPIGSDNGDFDIKEIIEIRGNS